MKSDGKKANKWSIFGSLGAAVAAAVCCLGPLVLVSFGVTGAWIGGLSVLEPYRPLFMVGAAGLLALGFYRVYGRSRHEDCGEGAECEVPKANRINQVSLWLATVVVVGLFASPYLLDIGLDGASAQTTSSEEQAELAHMVLVVEGMTCAGCARTVQSALEGLDGVEKAEVTYEPPQARVTYDPSQVGVEDMTEVTAEVGYPVTPKS